VGEATGTVRARHTDTDSTVLWQYDTSSAIGSDPAVTGNRIAVGADDDSLYLLDASMGDPLTKKSVGDRVHSSPTIVDGVLYVGDDSGTAVALDNS